MERSISLTDQEFSRIWTLASALYAKGRSLEDALREATRVYSLQMPELLQGGLRVTGQGDSELRLACRPGDIRSFALVVRTPEEAREEPEPARAAAPAPRPPEPRGPEPTASEPVFRPGGHLRLIRED
jgi:hypothetical protein